MKSQVKLVVNNKVGLHARPGALFMMMANKYQSTILISNLTAGRMEKNGKSIASILSLGIKQGHEILIDADGPDAIVAIEALKNLVNNNFGEPVSG
ncbi:MAG: HPr family phosphocarrier protein [Anaerolineae bacterium]|nr:HPr family phosphocarrier protein [Anaerolineae bacterium]